MPPKIRLKLIFAMLVLSAAYALIVKKDPSLASAISAGYIAVILTALLLVSIWKKPCVVLEDRDERER